MFTSFQKHLKHKSQTEIARWHFCMCNHQHLHLTACQPNKSFDEIDFEIDYTFSDKI